MKGSKVILLPKLTKMLEEMGENIKLARLRRKLTMEQVAARAGISRFTLRQVEKGEAGVSLGMYAQVLFVLKLEKDLLLIASNDVVGRKLQDVELLVKKKKATKEML
ncbi:hypothetical protein EZS27_018569 [termite gut metagenome]|uniref:HTH cro/C1-type domain-containing protein n=1 Tax=termite gut metagenome TaxID=433724 RepID=A0A5J4RIS4_9ZZZZ